MVSQLELGPDFLTARAPCAELVSAQSTPTRLHPRLCRLRSYASPWPRLRGSPRAEWPPPGPAPALCHRREAQRALPRRGMAPLQCQLHPLFPASFFCFALKQDHCRRHVLWVCMCLDLTLQTFNLQAVLPWEFGRTGLVSKHRAPLVNSK